MLLLHTYTGIAVFVFLFLGLLSTVFPTKKKSKLLDTDFSLAFIIACIWPIAFICLFIALIFDIINDYRRK